MENIELRWLHSGWLHSDLILTYKILFGLTSITASDFFSFPNPIHNTEAMPTNYLKTNVIQMSATFRGGAWNSLRVAPHNFSSVNS